LAISYELFTAVVIFLSKYFSNANEKRNKENIDIKTAGISVNRENNVIYFLLVLEPFILISSFKAFFISTKMIKKKD